MNIATNSQLNYLKCHFESRIFFSATYCFFFFLLRSDSHKKIHKYTKNMVHKPVKDFDIFTVQGFSSRLHVIASGIPVFFYIWYCTNLHVLSKTVKYFNKFKCLHILIRFYNWISIISMLNLCTPIINRKTKPFHDLVLFFSFILSHWKLKYNNSKERKKKKKKTIPKVLILFVNI